MSQPQIQTLKELEQLVEENPTLLLSKEFRSTVLQVAHSIGRVEGAQEIRNMIFNRTNSAKDIPFAPTTSIPDSAPPEAA